MDPTVTEYKTLADEVSESIQLQLPLRNKQQLSIWGIRSKKEYVAIIT